MKNKHLVLLFLAVVVLGLLVRQAPLRYRSFFHTPLFRIDPDALSRIVIAVPGQPDLTIERADYQWVAEQSGRTAVAPFAAISERLRLLSAIDSFEVLKTSLPDTLGFSPDRVLRIRFYAGNNLIEHVEVGAETTQNGTAYTCLRLPNHAGIYKAPGRFRTLFLLRLKDFRSAEIVDFKPEAIRRFGVQWRKKTPVFYALDSNSGRWMSADGRFSISADSVQAWLGLFKRLDNSPFADNFDESRERETLQTTIYLEAAPNDFLSLRIYALRPPDAPEDITALRAQGLRTLPAYVVQSSHNTQNYFAITDTNLVQRICGGLVRPPAADTTADPAQ